MNKSVFFILLYHSVCQPFAIQFFLLHSSSIRSRHSFVGSFYSALSEDALVCLLESVLALVAPASWRPRKSTIDAVVDAAGGYVIVVSLSHLMPSCSRQSNQIQFDAMRSESKVLRALHDAKSRRVMHFHFPFPFPFPFAHHLNLHFDLDFHLHLHSHHSVCIYAHFSVII